MKKIICYGDSNTFGYNPKDSSRYSSDIRWTGLLSDKLGVEFCVVEEGCNNRTGFVPSADGLVQSGRDYLKTCLDKHKDADVFILALGTNDLQKFYEIDESTVVGSLSYIFSSVQESYSNIRIILLPPVVLDGEVLKHQFSYQFDESSISKSKWIQDVFKTFSDSQKCELLDINAYVKPSVLDGLHFSEDSHRVIAEKIADLVLNS